MTFQPANISASPADMLLLNCSNLLWRPIYPYAFVQLSALGRKHGLNIVSKDLLYVDDWRPVLSQLIETHRPRSIGIHLRQADTVDLSDYHTQDNKDVPEHFRSYFPVDLSTKLISHLRELTDAPVFMGGFGFTTHNNKLMDELDLDFGVNGCPDGIIANFDNVMSGTDLGSVPNLIYRADGKTVRNDRIFATPADDTEYTPKIVEDMRHFYGDALYSEDPPTVAIEVSRGCPFSCFFCSEPEVKGNSTRFRDLDVVEEELNYLTSEGFRDFWFVCSELNIRGVGFAMDIAERVIRLNEKIGGGKAIRWSGYSLPSLNREELRTLKAAGYTGAINDILSLDEANLRRARVPYKPSQALEFMKSMIETRSGGLNDTDDNEKFTANTPQRFEGLISFFLGNAHIDEDTIPKTLKTLNDSGLQQYYNDGYVIPSTRTFPNAGTGPFFDDPNTVTFGPDGLAKPDISRPSFHFSPFLSQHLGSRENIVRYMDFVAETYMSVAHRKSPKWAKFVSRNLDDADLFSAMCNTFPDSQTPANKGAAVSILDDQPEEFDVSAHEALRTYFEKNITLLLPVLVQFPNIEFDGGALLSSEYEIAREIYRVLPTRSEYVKYYTNLKSDPARLFHRYIEKFANFSFNPTYRDMTFGQQKELMHG